MKQITKRKRCAGAAVLEAALTLGLYTSMVFSIIDYGFVMYMHQTIASRVSAAARYGALNPTDITGMQNYVLHNQSTGTGAGIFGITSANVTASRVGSGTSADRVVVTVTGFHYPMIAPGLSGTAKPITVMSPVEAN
jgi:Flp pilus assembly protein TadG